MYLKPIRINYEKAGFCILEFSVSSAGVVNNPSVVWSTGSGFEDTAFLILSSMKQKVSPFFQDLNSKKLRLPIYFNNFTNMN
ncbi:MAG: hypothetical protein CMG55_09865 [Candidatus Marinimicrobia bacterium]|nr:hypothetical protein [Candidatus Neomarinimicrobiota bacterium]